MTTHQAKKDLAARLAAEGVKYDKLTARTVDFTDLARATPIFVTIHAQEFKRGVKEKIKEGIPKPSLGGYMVQVETKKWVD